MAEIPVKRFLLTQETLVPLGFLMTVAGAFAWAALWLNGHFDQMGADVREVKYKVERIEEHLTDRITRSDVEAWILKFGRQNPSLNIPDLSK